jgi:hypothetical protein
MSGSLSAPYLIDLDEVGPEHPLSQFQCKRTTEKDTYDVVRSMHSALLKNNKDDELTIQEVKAAFDMWWPKLDEQLKSMPVVDGIPKKEEPNPGEMLALIKGIARSVSALQVAASVPAYSIVGGPVAPYLYAGAPVTPSGDFGAGPRPMETGILRGAVYNMPPREAGGKFGEPAPHDTQIILVCPNCGRSDGISLKGLAQTVENDRARHLTGVCEHCGNLEFGTHISRHDKSKIWPCPPDCPHHPH